MADRAARRDEPQACDVAIVGCGPVGAMLANLLGLQGISAVAIEREPDLFPLPRAVHFDDEVMRLLQTVGLSAAMLPLVHVSPGMRFVDEDGRLLLDWPRPPEVGPQGWHVSYRFHQPELERVLRAGLQRWPTVGLRTGTEVLAIEPGAAAMTLTCCDRATGQISDLTARYVVGCDGANSLVRQLIGGGLEDLGFQERWLVVDAILRRPRPDLGDHSVQFCSRTRPATYVRGTGNRRRWEITLHPDEDTASATTAARVFELLSPWVGPDDVTLERNAVYTFRSAVAERWHAGRLLIAGDAAHLTPPFMGQGLCAGMRDVGNLAWKLGRVLRGQDSPELLETYQTERAAHVREYIELAVRLGGLINTKAMEMAVPDAVLAGGAPAQMSSIRPRLGPGLAGGWTAARGMVAPQPRLAGTDLFDDHVGYRHALLMRPAFERRLDATLIDRMSARGVVMLADDSPGCRDWLDGIAVQAVLVRPDRYIQGAARDLAEMQDLAASV
jgi:3-(3-hydroxy-phenyl)propionate hydroxylase